MSYEITGEMSIHFSDPELYRQVKYRKSILQEDIKVYIRDLLCAAAILAISNIGMGRPTRDKVQRALKCDRFNLDTFVVSFGQKYMDVDDHYDMFMAEADTWVKLLSEEDDWKVGSWRDVYDDLIV